MKPHLKKKKKSGKQNGDGWIGAFFHESKAEIS